MRRVLCLPFLALLLALPVVAQSPTFGPRAPVQIFPAPTGVDVTSLPSLTGSIASPTDLTFANAGVIRGDTTTAHTWLLQGYDNNTGPGYVTFGTITNGNTPSLAWANPAGGGTITYNGLTLAAASVGFTVAGGTTSKTATIAGNFTTAHGDDLTLTTTGSTNVTLPTTGTIDTTHVSGNVTRTSADVTTASTSLTDLTGASITLTTGANPVMLYFTGSPYIDTITAHLELNFDIDGTAQLGSAGLSYTEVSAASAQQIVGMAHLSAALTAASHTFKVRWRTSAGTATMSANSGTAYSFSVVEVH